MTFTFARHTHTYNYSSRGLEKFRVNCELNVFFQYLFELMIADLNTTKIEYKFTTWHMTLQQHISYYNDMRKCLDAAHIRNIYPVIEAEDKETWHASLFAFFNMVNQYHQL